METTLDRAALEHVVMEKLRLQLPAAGALAPETPLISVGLDSVGVIILVADLEGSLGFTLAPEDLDMAHFQSVSTLCAFLAGNYRFQC
jgi:acyl carrier protein